MLQGPLSYVKKPQPFSSRYSLLIPWKHQKTFCFLMFLGGSKGNTGKKRVKTNFSFPLFLTLHSTKLLTIRKSISNLSKFLFILLQKFKKKKTSRGVGNNYSVNFFCKLIGLVSTSTLHWLTTRLVAQFFESC